MLNHTIVSQLARNHSSKVGKMRAVLPVIIVVVLGSLGVFAVSPSDYKSAAVFQQMGALMKTHGESLVKVK